MRTVKSALAEAASRHTRLVITGASGWLGRELVDLILSAWGPGAAGQILALGNSDRRIMLASGRTFTVHAWQPGLVEEFGPDFLVHLAFRNREFTDVMPAAQYVEENLGLTRRIASIVSKSNLRGVLFTSSGAAMDQGTESNRDLYGALKRNDEVLIPLIADAFGAVSVMCRVWSVSGANIQNPNGFVLGSLIQQALAGSDLVVLAEHPVMRRYVDAGELLGIGLLAMLRGQSTSFDSGGDLVEIGELAERILGLVGRPHTARVLRDRSDDGLADDYAADPSSMDLVASRLNVTLARLDDQIVRTALGMRHSTGWR